MMIFLLADITSIFSKFSPKRIGEHINLYLSLYIKPIQSWKKAMHDSDDGYLFIIHHAIYYSLLILIIVGSFSYALGIIFLDLFLTIIPIFIFIIPYYLFTKIFKLKLPKNSIIRVFLILKFQCLPIILFLTFTIKWLEYEIYYIILDNSIWLLWILFIIIPPFISSINVFKKFLWIVINYIFFIGMIAPLGSLILKIDINKKYWSSLSLMSPDKEYLHYFLQDSMSLYDLRADKYLAIMSKIDDTSSVIISSQFVTESLLSLIHKSGLNIINSNILYLDSLRKTIDTTYDSDNKKIIIDTTLPKLDIKLLNNYRVIYNKKFYNDLKLYKTASDSLIFKSNSEYFNLSYRFLNHYDSLNSKTSITKHILKEIKPYLNIALDSGKHLVLINLDSTLMYSKELDYWSSLNKLQDRSDKANFILDMLSYPHRVIANRFNFPTE